MKTTVLNVLCVVIIILASSLMGICLTMMGNDTNSAWFGLFSICFFTIIFTCLIMFEKQERVKLWYYNASDKIISDCKEEEIYEIWGYATYSEVKKIMHDYYVLKTY